jgi:hypothetical protein
VSQKPISELKFPAGVQRLLDEARIDVTEVLHHLPVSRATTMTEDTRIKFETKQFPMYFTSAFEAPLVLVHLNPKLSPRMNDQKFRTFDEYLDDHRRFGHLHWEHDPKYRSAFDRKQVRFLKHFGVIEFLDDSDPPSSSTNPARAIDCKLQLELVPYATPDFPTSRFSVEDLRPHFQRVLDVIAAYDRKYVLFCGAVFEKLLNQSGYELEWDHHDFHLPLVAGGMSKNPYHFSNVLIDYSGEPVRAAVARSFAIPGIPMSHYGQRCHQLYDAWKRE